MKKNLLISAIVIAIVVATVAISFAAWDLFKAKDNVTFNTGDNVQLKVEKDKTYKTTDVLVPENAIKQNDTYKYEVVMAKNIELKITTGEATTDTVEYTWDLTEVTVDTVSTVIKDVKSFKEYFVITMRPAGADNDTTDVELGGKLDITKKYDLVIKFAIDAKAQEQKVDPDDDTKKVWFNSDTELEVSYTDAEYDALSADDKAKLSKVMIDIFGDKFDVSEFKVKEITLEITFEAVNKTEEPAA